MEAPKCYDAFQKMTQRDYPLSQQATDNTRPVGWNGRFSITITLVTAIGLLTLLSVGGVLGVGVCPEVGQPFRRSGSNRCAAE